MIQIDMQMPDACDICPFNYDFCWCKAFVNYDEWKKYSDDWNDHVCDRETRPEYCPLKEQPEIVRCKDCDNKECWGRAGDVVCGIDGTPHRPDWFCADGEA